MTPRNARNGPVLSDLAPDLKNLGCGCCAGRARQRAVITAPVVGSAWIGRQRPATSSRDRGELSQPHPYRSTPRSLKGTTEPHPPRYRSRCQKAYARAEGWARRTRPGSGWNPHGVRPPHARWRFRAETVAGKPRLPACGDIAGKKFAPPRQERQTRGGSVVPVADRN